MPENAPILSNGDNLPFCEEKRICNAKELFCNAIAFENSNGGIGGDNFSEEKSAVGGLPPQWRSSSSLTFEHQGERSGKYLIAPFGDFKNGEWTQRVDAIAGENLKRNMRGVWARIKNAFGNACPVFYEHPDHEDDLEIPNVADKTPYGRVRELEILPNGIYANIEWLDGFELLPKRLQISPRWNSDTIGDKIARPARLISLGLTRDPNIKDTSFVNSTQLKEQTTMNEIILKLLGYSDEEAKKYMEKASDAPTDVLERIQKALEEKTTLANDELRAERARSADLAQEVEGKDKEIAEKDKELSETKTALANSQEALKNSQKARAKLVIANAVRAGKVTQAQSADAELILANSENFDEAAEKIEKQPAQYKTTPASDGIEKGEKARQLSKQKASLEIEKLVAEKQQSGMAYSEAWNAVKAEKPELFKTAFGSDE